MARANVVICGDAVQTSLEPLKSIMERAEELEATVDGVMGVQVFNGQSWVDEPYMGPSFVVTHRSDTELAKKCAKELAKMFYDACKEIQPVHSEGDQPWVFFGRNDAKAETSVLWPPHAKS